MVYELTDSAAAKGLFGDWKETLIDSCMQQVMESCMWWIGNIENRLWHGLALLRFMPESLAGSW